MSKIPLFFWSNKRLQKWAQENYGDLLSAYLVEKLSRKPVHWIHPRKIKWLQPKKHYFAIGSILAQATKHSHIWGSGIITSDQQIAPATFYAVRGPQTRRRVLELGYACPEVYGDPGLLLPLFYNPSVTKKHVYGWIPHYADQDLFENFKISKNQTYIDLKTNDVEATTREILACECIISSSLHGLIVAHAYGIPAIWIRWSDRLYGDDIKFRDYFESVGIIPYKGIDPNDVLNHKEFSTFSAETLASLFKNIAEAQRVPEREIITQLQDGLLASCPFIANE
ncbi:polysaccharide pyruvyl transferase family protein [Dokdonia ponticola]|uniref:Polysaccharide pyruvyl transferase family protein n=1 Tax=Dokdonia ponticola TaxID=2041041 RepID=A0ABV9I4A1_9FLAO